MKDYLGKARGGCGGTDFRLELREVHRVRGGLSYFKSNYNTHV